MHMFWLTLFIKSENTNQLKTWIESTFHPLPHVKIPLPQEGFPPQILRPEATAGVVLHIHRCLGLEEPLHNPLCTFQGREKQRCRASGAVAQGQAAGRTQRNGRGEKFWENLGTSKIESFGNLVAIQTPLGCKEQFVGLRCLEAIELVETAMWTMLAAWVWIHVESESYWIQSGSNVGISRQMHWHLSNQAGIPNPEISFRVQSRWLG